MSYVNGSPEDGVNEGVQYWVTLVAQFLIGVACPLAFCLPNKVCHQIMTSCMSYDYCD